MNEQQSLQAMQANPQDDSLCEVLADWLKQRGDRRGELLRIRQLQRRIEVPNREQVAMRLQELLAEGVWPVGPRTTNTHGMKLAWIASGEFLMGSPSAGRRPLPCRHEPLAETGRFDLATETPSHTVHLGSPGPGPQRT